MNTTRTARSWWFGPALLTAVILMVAGVQVIRQSTVLPSVAATCDAELPAADQLPTGAISVSLCDITDSTAMVQQAAPVDALVEGVDELVAAYQQLPSTPPFEVCLQTVPRVGLVFSYPDGTHVRLAPDADGCDRIGDRYGLAALIIAFVDRLVAQRTRQQPWTGPTAAPVCPFEHDRRSWVTPVPGDLTNGSARLCVTSTRPDSTELSRAVRPSSAEWAILQADLVENSARAKSGDESAFGCDTVRQLVATNAYGDQLTIQIHGNGNGWWQVPFQAEETWMKWQPSTRARAIIDRLTA